MANTASTFDEANKVVHKVETQWHYPILTQYGYKPDNDTAVGFVRSYTYTHPVSGRHIKVCTGYNADYWVDLTTDDTGYWKSLEPHLISISN